MKKLLFFAVSAVMLFSACSKKDDGVDSYVTVDGATYSTPYGYHLYNNDKVAFYSTDMSTALNGDDVTYTYVEIGFDELIDGATYTYMPWYEDNYDPTKHFWKAAVYKEVNSTYYADGVKLEYVTSGTVTMRISSGTNYTINYNLIMEDGTSVKGQYKGTLTRRG